MKTFFFFFYTVGSPLLKTTTRKLDLECMCVTSWQSPEHRLFFFFSNFHHQMAKDSKEKKQIFRNVFKKEIDCCYHQYQD